MRQFLRSTLLLVLKWLARAVIARYRPKIVAITGSVGKTTTKELVAWVLSGQFRVAKTPLNANTAWGVMPVIIEPEFLPTKTTDGWVKVSLWQYLGLLISALDKLIFAREYPQILVLELAADRPGVGISEFNRLMKYDVGIITVIGHVHVEFYKTPEALRDEKLSVVGNLVEDGTAIVGANLRELVSERLPVGSRLITVGENGAVRLANFQFGQGYAVTVGSRAITVRSAVSRAVALAAPFAVAAANTLGMDWPIIAERLATFVPPSGRFEVYKLDRGISLINDAYNANPESMTVALQGLADLAASLGPGHRRVAILGQMRELGVTHEANHAKIGQLVPGFADLLVAVGEGGKLIANSAKAAGMSDSAIIYLDWPAAPASDFLAHLVDNDVVLVKASKSIGLSELANQLKAALGGR